MGAARIRAVTEGASPPLSSPDNLPASLAPSTALRAVSLHRLRRGGEQGTDLLRRSARRAGPRRLRPHHDQAAQVRAAGRRRPVRQRDLGPGAARRDRGPGHPGLGPGRLHPLRPSPWPWSSAGHERHDIFCKPCHGVSGAGDGTIVARGFPPPPPYWDLKVAAATPAHLFDVITHGYGVMYPYAERIPPADRWAIVAYVRALEVAHTQGAPDVKPPAGSSGGARDPLPPDRRGRRRSGLPGLGGDGAGRAMAGGVAGLADRLRLRLLPVAGIAGHRADPPADGGRVGRGLRARSWRRRPPLPRCCWSSSCRCCSGWA